MARPEADDFEDDGMSVAEKRRRAAAKADRAERRRAVARWALRGYVAAFVPMVVVGATHLADGTATMMMKTLLALAPVAIVASIVAAPPHPTDEERAIARAGRQVRYGRAASALWLASRLYFALLIFCFGMDAITDGPEITPTLLLWGAVACIPVGAALGLLVTLAAGEPGHLERPPYVSRYVARQFSRWS